MATNILSMSGHGLENECREIHDSRGQLNRLIPSLARRSQLERQQIRETYKTMYGEDLISCLQRYETGISPTKSAVFSLWMFDPHDRDAVIAREALEQGDTNYKALVEIFVCRKSCHILLMKQAYQRRFRRELDQDIINIEPPHPCQKILVALAASHKAHQADISQHIGRCDARRLYETGKGGSGATEEAVVLEILSKRSIQQLKLTFASYKHIYGHDYTKSLKRGNSEELEHSLKMVVKCIYSPPRYYAKTLYSSIKGRTIDRGSVERVLMSRAEVDMDEIQRIFKQKYAEELKDLICEGILSGDYRGFLVALATRTT